MGGVKGFTSLMADLEAIWAISAISAPEKPFVSLARSLKSTPRSTGVFLVTALKIDYLASRSGSGM